MAGFRAALRRHPPTDPDALARYRDRRFRELIHFAYTRVDYYRELFDRENLRPSDIRGVADLPRIPISTKDSLRAVPLSARLARGLDPARLICRTSEGTTGEPFPVWRTWGEERLLQAFRRRATRWYGATSRQLCARVNMPREAEAMDRPGLHRLLMRAGWLREAHIDVLLPPEEVWRRLCELQPDLIAGYPGALEAAARAAPPVHAEVPRPSLVFLGGEVVTPAAKRCVAEAFDAPALSLYASTEFNLMGSECSQSNLLHITDDAVLVEVEHEQGRAGPGQSGEVIVTGLFSQAMPLIRYRQGDRVTLGPRTCPCGAAFSTLSDVQGRTVDYFRLPDGSLIHPYELADPVNRFPWIRQYQLVQERSGRVLFRILPDGLPVAEDLAWIDRHFEATLGDKVPFAVQTVTELEARDDGKFRVYRSDLTADSP